MDVFSVLTIREYSLKRTVERGEKDVPGDAAARSSNEKTDKVTEETSAVRSSTEKTEQRG